MARVNVDQEFWSDPRFDYFANMIGEETVPAHVKKLWLSRFRILLLWNHCYNKRTSKLNQKQIAYACQFDGDAKQLIDALVEADVIVADEDGYMVKGIDHRIAYLKAQSEKGKKGGRPKKQKLSNSKADERAQVSEVKPNASKYQSLPLDIPLPLSPALSPAPAQELNTPLPPCEGEPAPDCNFESEEPKDQTPSQEAKPKKEPFDARAMCIIWNLAIEDGANFVGVREDSVKPGTKRHRAVTARIREQPDPDYWIATIERLMGSDFANGRSKTAWRADFDFFVRPDTHIKINEGKYDNV